MKSAFWNQIRLTRSSPPGEAADETRAALYRAALQQFEDLMAAAEATGPAARPLPLFYALSQAGRAIVMARGGQSVIGHGLTIAAPIGDLLLTEVVPGRHGWFQSLTQAVDSPTLSMPASLGSLMASLPELGDELLSGPWHKPLPIHVDASELAWLHQFEVPTLVVFPSEVRTAQDAANLLRHYPVAARGKCELNRAHTILAELPRRPTDSGMGVDVMWPHEAGDFYSIVPEYRWAGYRYLRPAVAEGSEPPSPLMTWWAILYALSMLARYYPVPWVEALNLDSSAVAVTLDRAMTEALEAIPHLVLDAVLGT